MHVLKKPAPNLKAVSPKHRTAMTLPRISRHLGIGVSALSPDSQRICNLGPNISGQTPGNSWNEGKKLECPEVAVTVSQIANTRGS